MSLDKISILMCVPVYYQSEKVVKALESMATLKVDPGVSIDLVFGLNGVDDTIAKALGYYLPELVSAGCFRSVAVKDFDKNIGKGPAVNRIYQECKDNGYDFLLSADSDITYPDPDFLTKMIGAFRKVGGLGGVAAEQVGNCCHWKHNSEVCHKGDYTLRYYRENQGVAGGVILIPVPVWEKIGGYKTVPHSTYGGNDAFFMRDCFKEHLNVPVLEDAKVFHPRETNPGYASWKKRSCGGDLGPGEEVGFNF